MSTYEYGRIGVLADSLAKEGIPSEVAEQVLEGGDRILRGTSPEAKAAWMGEAMRRMDTLLDARTVHAVRERCACCLGGKRLKVSRGIAKEHESLADRVRAANEAKFVFGHSVSLTPDGDVLICFSPEGEAHYRCPCLPKAKEPLSITYCYCCGGHAKHHLQMALGRKLELMEVRSSALSSGGTKPCTFLLRLLE